MTPSRWKHLLTSCLFLLAGPAAGTSMLSADVSGLSRDADAVVRGKVQRVESRWNGDRTRIFTDVEIQVDEALKGEAGATVLVTQPGGQVGDIGQKVSGLAAFEPREEVVVFLKRRGPRTFQVAGMAQGKFKVERGSDGKSVLAVPSPTGDAQLIDPATRQPTRSVLRTLSLSELRAQVRSAVEAQGPGPAGQRR